MRLLVPLTLNRGWMLLLALTLVALPVVALGALLRWRAGRAWDAHERWSGIKFLALLGCITYALLNWVGHPAGAALGALLADLATLQLSSAVRSLGWLCLLHLLLAPAVALVLELVRHLTHAARLRPRRASLPSPRTGAEAAEPSSGQLPVSTGPASPLGAFPLLPGALRAPSPEPLGTFLGGDLYEWVVAGQLSIPLPELKRHAVVIGEPGYGKTITLLRLAVIAARYGMQVIYIDLKGSPKTAAQFVAAMSQQGIEQRRIKIYPREPYDGWRGDPGTLYNRLMQMVDPGTHPFYHKLTSSLVSLAVNAPGGPPTSSRDFLLRLDRDWLYRAYAGESEERARLRRKVHKLVPHLADLSLTFEGFFDGIEGGLDGRWACEDGDAVYIGLDGDARKELAGLMGRYLLEDCAHYAKYRKGPRHAFVVIDEFGVLGSANATDLYERVREPGMSICASAQSYEGLGPERKNVVAASSIKILHRCGDPEEMVRYAGMREVPAFVYALGEGAGQRPSGDGDQPAGRTTVRMQREYAMPIEEVQQLAIGRVGLISGGLGAWCQVYPPTIPASLLQATLTFLGAGAASLPSPAVPTNPEQSGPPSETSASRRESVNEERTEVSLAPRAPEALPRVALQAEAQRVPEAQIHAKPSTTASMDDSPVDY